MKGGNTDPVSAPVSTPVSNKNGKPGKRKINRIAKLGGDNFDAIEQRLAAQAEEKKQQLSQQDDTISKEINPAIEIDRKAFDQHVNVYLERLKSQNKMNLASAIQNGKSSFVHNKWCLSVENHIFKGLLEQEQDILPFFRDKLDSPSLFLEVEVDEALAPQQDEIPYTEEGKLEAMNEKNPLVQKLQKIFKTRIIYE